MTPKQAALRVAIIDLIDKHLEAIIDLIDQCRRLPGHVPGLDACLEHLRKPEPEPPKAQPYRYANGRLCECSICVPPNCCAINKSQMQHWIDWLEDAIDHADCFALAPRRRGGHPDKAGKEVLDFLRLLLARL